MLSNVVITLKIEKLFLGSEQLKPKPLQLIPFSLQVV